MRIVRARHDGEDFYAVVDGSGIEVLYGVPYVDGIHPSGKHLEPREFTLLAPVAPRGKIIGIGLNYPKPGLGDEVGAAPARPERPIVFLKANSSVIGPGEAVQLPPVEGEIWHEGELAVVIGRRTRMASVAEAEEAIFGCTIADDVSARDQMYAEVQWDRAKGYDTFCPLGPAIETGFDAAGYAIRTYVDGELRKEGHTRDLLFSVPELISYLSHSWTLGPGDLILTGTPAGDGTITPGQQVDIEIDGIGTLSNPVVARSEEYAKR